MWAKHKHQSGFTIVELLIVIVVIAILAAISIVAYNGISQRARDAERTQELSSIRKALSMYYVDKGGYPTCSGTTYVAGAPSDANGATTCLTSALVPTYISSIPTDPKNTGANSYFYAIGYKKITANSFNETFTQDYIIGTKLENSSSTYTGWGYPLNYLESSSN